MHKVEIPIDRESSNVPMVFNCGVTAKEMRLHGPHIRSALPKYERMIDCLGSWSAAHFRSWKIATEAIVDLEFEQVGKAMGFSAPCVGVEDNKNLSSAQKEVLLWHWKLGISMQRVQELMRAIEVEEPDGSRSTMDRVITPKIKAAATCPIPLCQSCQLSRATLRKPKIRKSKAIEDTAGAISREKYETGDFVSMDQYVVRTPGRLSEGYGRETDANMYHGGTIFRDAASKYIHVENQVSLGAGETVQSKLKFEEWLYDQARVRVKHYHSNNGVFQAEVFKESIDEQRQT